MLQEYDQILKQADAPNLSAHRYLLRFILQTLHITFSFSIIIKT